MTTEKSRINQGISFEPAILPPAKKRAKARRQSFSAYVCSLISADLGCELSATKPTTSAEHPGEKIAS